MDAGRSGFGLRINTKIKNMFTAILVDDMPQALKVLANDLSDLFPDIKVIGMAESIVDAAKLLRKQTPDFLFLDIMLGDGTGFDLLEIFPDLTSKIIFVTAYEEHAIRAFRFSAVDYLLKPINPAELQQAVEKAKKQLSNSNDHLSVLKETFHNPHQLPERISLHTMEKITIVKIADIVRCEADSNNTLFVLNSGKTIFVTKTLKEYEKLLAGHDFYRSHQSHLINMDHIREYVRKDGGYLMMKNGDHVPVAVRKKVEMIDLLNRMK